ncbi:MAG: hypothetical protein NVSMB3_05660 [Acidobacteriaceae bacterium]
MILTNRPTETEPKRSHPWTRWVCGLALAAMVAVAPISMWAQHEPEKGFLETFTVDVALDGNTLVLNHADPTLPPTVQATGDLLLIYGTIFPGGTLPSGFADNDLNTPGGIGKIRCRALVLVPSDDITTPGASFVTELYSFPDDKQTIVADGLGANLFVTLSRAVLGGTKRFEGVTGELIEQNLGTNKTGGCNLRITFRIRRPGGERHGD